MRFACRALLLVMWAVCSFAGAPQGVAGELQRTASLDPSWTIPSVRERTSPFAEILESAASASPSTTARDSDVLFKMAYGRTFGTCTELDYATLELGKSLLRFPTVTVTTWGPLEGEVQMAMLASYVVYSGGHVERLKRLDFRDGYELGWLPKGRFRLPMAGLGLSPYVESGAGIGYVSETYRNSGSRWNWSLLGGLGFEKGLPWRGTVSFGVQWRHLSNGNMWGKGDELHNSNSGTDMVQAMATFLHRF